jgi:hypothetical protein
MWPLDGLTVRRFIAAAASGVFCFANRSARVLRPSTHAPGLLLRSRAAKRLGVALVVILHPLSVPICARARGARPPIGPRSLPGAHLIELGSPP